MYKIGLLLSSYVRAPKKQETPMHVAKNAACVREQRKAAALQHAATQRRPPSPGTISYLQSVERATLVSVSGNGHGG